MRVSDLLSLLQFLIISRGMAKLKEKSEAAYLDEGIMD